MTRNPLWDLIESYMDNPKHRYRPRPADLARETGISEQVLSKWKARPVLPSPQMLFAFSQGTGIPYPDLLTAALRGRAYLPAFSGEVVIGRRMLRSLMEHPWREGSASTAEEIMENLDADLSEPGDKVHLAVAAYEEETSIAGEQEESDTP